MEDSGAFVDEKERGYGELYRGETCSYWDAVLSGEDEKYEAYTEADLKIKNFFNNSDDFGKVKKFLEIEGLEPKLKRKLKILYNLCLEAAGDKALVEEITRKEGAVKKMFNVFRPSLGGEDVSDNDIKKILSKEKDSGKLKEAWEASKKRGEICCGPIVEIIKLRNKLAKSLGFENYYLMSLEFQEQNIDELKKVFDELEEKTDAPFRKLMGEINDYLSVKHDIDKSELRPWHYEDPYFQEGPSIYDVDLDSFYGEDILVKARSYYESLGFDIDDIIKFSDLYERKGKYPHACCIDMDRKGDVRTINNLINNEKWMDTILHELGHAVYGKNYDEADSFLLRDSPNIYTTEAIALLFGRKSRNPNFIMSYCGADVEGVREDISKMLRVRQIVFCRWCLVMFNFEQELYRNPDQDLNKLWWDMVKKYQLIDFSRDKPDWASKVHLASCPVYYHHYMLGELMASQLHNYIVENYVGDFDSDYSGNKDVSKYLIEKIFKAGNKYTSSELVERATGEKLTAKYFVVDFCN